MFVRKKQAVAVQGFEPIFAVECLRIPVFWIGHHQGNRDLRVQDSVHRIEQQKFAKTIIAKAKPLETKTPPSVPDRDLYRQWLRRRYLTEEVA